MTRTRANVQVQGLQRFIATSEIRVAEMRDKRVYRKSWLFRASNDDGRDITSLDGQSREAFNGFLHEPIVKMIMRADRTLSSLKFTNLSATAEMPH